MPVQILLIKTYEYKFYPPAYSITEHNTMEFSTYDKDNDRFTCNCAAERGGGDWWNSCGVTNMNGLYGGKGDSGLEFMFWHGFALNKMALKSMRLMFRQ